MTRAFEKAGDRREDLLSAMSMPVTDKEHRQAKIEAVKGIYDALGICEDAKREISRLHSQALGYVSQLELAPEAEALLHSYATALLGRQK